MVPLGYAHTVTVAKKGDSDSESERGRSGRRVTRCDRSRVREQRGGGAILGVFYM